MKGGRFFRKASPPVGDVADLVGYARSEFRDGRTEREVLALLIKSGQPDSIQGVVHELYLECMEVRLRDRAFELAVQAIGLPIAIGLFFIAQRTWMTGVLLLAEILLYFGLVHLLCVRHWEKRFRRRLEERSSLSLAQDREPSANAQAGG